MRTAQIKKLEENIVNYTEKIYEMKAKAAEVQSDIKAEYLFAAKSLEKKRDDFVVEYGQLKGNSRHS